MEKLEGRTLRHTLMALSRLSVREALNIAIQIADGMQLAHESGVIHRDLKPENIFIEAGNHLKVLDFGVAKVLGASQMTTRKDRVQGTVFYMSPEQLQGVAVTPASDVFALGTMLFEMLYGHPLMLGGGDLPNNEHVAWMQLYKVPPPLETLDANIPRYVGKLVGRAIVKLPKDRYQTMREFRDAAMAALRRYEKDRAAIEDPPTPRELSGAPARALVAIPQTQAPEPDLPKVDAPTPEVPKPIAIAGGKKSTVFALEPPSADPKGAEPTSGSTTKSPRALILGFLVGAMVIALFALGSRSSPPQRTPAGQVVVQRVDSDSKPAAVTDRPHLEPVPAQAERVASTAAPAQTAIATVPTATIPVRAQTRNPTKVSSGLAEKADAASAPSVASKSAQARNRETIF